MAMKKLLIEVQICIVLSLTLVICVCYYTRPSLYSYKFPEEFLFGASSSAYQYEGAASEDGRAPSIWDTFTLKHPEKIKDGSNGNVTIDFYHKYKEDIGLMKRTNLDAFRLSLSWSRILPNGKLSGGVNKEGIKFYNNVINELLANGIQPFVTLFHFDLPQALEDEYGGFLSSHIVDDFRDYAELCYREFGDRVKHFLTMNEPWTYSRNGYALGVMAPGRCSDWQKLNCTGGDSATEPYLVARNQLLAHAAAVQVYKQKFQATQEGKIGLTLPAHWFVPYSNESYDRDAVQRSLDFMLGWYMDPLTTGYYPHSMQSIVQDRLPKFSAKQAKAIKGSFDFLGLNYYTSRYAANASAQNNGKASYLTDSGVTLLSERDGIPIGPKGTSTWVYSYPQGLEDLLLYIKNKYNNPEIYITENGIDQAINSFKSLEEALNDTERINFHHEHLIHMWKAIKNGVNVKGYFVWSLLDNFEWPLGYTSKFGMNYVDFKDGLKRYPKLSAHWYAKTIKAQKDASLIELVTSSVGMIDNVINKYKQILHLSF